LAEITIRIMRSFPEYDCASTLADGVSELLQ